MAARAKCKAAGTAQRDSVTAGEETGEAPLRPGQCRDYMRRELAKEFRGIVKGFVEGAKTGSCQHVKLATELVGTQRPARKKGKSSVRRLIEDFESGRI
jgi:hypothetical protein